MKMMSDNDSSTDSEYNSDSYGNGSEAEIHDSGTQFEGEEPTINGMYGVELVSARMMVE